MRFLKISVLASVVATAACSSSTNNNEAPAPTVDAATVEDVSVPDGGAAETATLASSFTQVYGDIISPICVTCHNPHGIGVSMGHLDMSSQSTAFSNLVGVAAMGIACGGMGTRVVAGSAGTSILFEKVDPGQPAPCGSKMPLGLTPLTTAQADEIQSWIQAGAPNN